jgi:hypothetical protein
MARMALDITQQLGDHVVWLLAARVGVELAPSRRRPRTRP